jgi:hypothetical protein
VFILRCNKRKNEAEEFLRHDNRLRSSFASLPNIASIVGSSPPRKLSIDNEQILPALRVSHCRDFIDAGRIHERGFDCASV